LFQNNGSGVSCLDPDEFVTIEDVLVAVVAGPYSFVLVVHEDDA
ncbi:hypothetical protein Tco_1230636, partial [Tanacetum coccineum]